MKQLDWLAKYDAMEGAMEIRFCDSEGIITASWDEISMFLISEGFNVFDVNKFIHIWIDETTT